MPQSISHDNVPFCNRIVHMCAQFCYHGYRMVDCGIFVSCTVGFVRWVYGNCKHRSVLPHDDVIKWKHFSCYWLHQLPVNSPHKGQWHRALIFFICTYINCMRCHHAHYDVIVINCLHTVFIVISSNYPWDWTASTYLGNWMYHWN